MRPQALVKTLCVSSVLASTNHLILIWMLVNTLLIGHIIHGKAFDPYPYIALNLVLSGLAGIQAPIIMMSQNRAAARDEALAQHHYEETRRSTRYFRQTPT
jgi:uncharacterized membrane protein